MAQRETCIYLGQELADYGFKAEQRKPYTFNPAPFLADKTSGQQGYVTSDPFAIKTEGGFDPNVFLLADYGFDTYATTIETTTDMVENKPELVQCFVDGSAIGWYNYLYGDSAAANAAIKKDNPSMSDEQIAFSIEQMKKYGIVDSGDAEKLGIGAMSDERFKSFFDKMVAAGVVDAGIDYKKSYTLQFVNKGVLDAFGKLAVIRVIRLLPVVDAVQQDAPHTLLEFSDIARPAIVGRLLLRNESADLLHHFRG